MDFYKRKSENLAKNVYPVIKDIYQTRGETIENIVIPITDGVKGIQVMANLKKAYESQGKEIINSVEKGITLSIIDDAWKEHLRQMDELKQSVQNAVYEQKDPLLIYKLEAFKLFRDMITEVNKEVISFLFKGTLPNQGNQQVDQARTPQRTDYSRMKTGRENMEGLTNPQARNGNRQMEDGEELDNEAPKKLEPIRVGPKVGRNDPCPCGSGKKYKKCHGKGE
jgi:preprotein translocase subunit SecA